MNRLLNPSSDDVRILAIIYCVIGLILVVFGVDILSTAFKVVGGIAILAGLIMIYFTFFSKKRRIQISTLFFSIPAIFIGLLMFFSPESLLSVLPTIFSVLLIIHSLVHIDHALKLRKFGFNNWIASLGVGIVILAVGILILYQPIQALSFVLRLVGIGLIVEAIILLIDDNLFKKYMEH